MSGSLTREVGEKKISTDMKEIGRTRRREKRGDAGRGQQPCQTITYHYAPATADLVPHSLSLPLPLPLPVYTSLYSFFITYIKSILSPLFFSLLCFFPQISMSMPYAFIYHVLIIVNSVVSIIYYLLFISPFFKCLINYFHKLIREVDS